MTYNEFINSIIKERGQWNIPDGEYFEGHHIIPRCLGGEGYTRQKHPNIVRLFPKEHFIAHKLLAQENPNNKKIVNAFSCMAFPKGKTQRKSKLYLTPEEYEEARIVVSKGFKGKNNPMYGKNWKIGKSDEEIDSIRKKMSKSMREFHKNNPNHITGERNPMWHHKYTEETLKKFRNRKNLLGFSWYNNGVKNIIIGPREIPPFGFKKGKLKMGIYYNNGCKNILVKFGELPPNGFKIGRKPLKKSWFNNGVVSIMSIECPDGFIKGRIKNIKWLLPNGTIKIMDKSNAHKYHPDWIELKGE